MWCVNGCLPLYVSPARNGRLVRGDPASPRRCWDRLQPEKITRKLFFRIVQPSLPALFSGELLFPGQDQYKAPCMAQGYYFWICHETVQAKRKGEFHNLSYQRLIPFFDRDSWWFTLLLVSGCLTLNAGNQTMPGRHNYQHRHGISIRIFLSEHQWGGLMLLHNGLIAWILDQLLLCLHVERLNLYLRDSTLKWQQRVAYHTLSSSEREGTI